MSAPKDQLIDALCRRRDQEALVLIKENPSLIDQDNDEKIIRLALDHGCVKVIRYLRRKTRSPWRVKQPGFATRQRTQRQHFAVQQRFHGHREISKIKEQPWNRTKR